jgi:hypothetical protein
VVQRVPDSGLRTHRAPAVRLAPTLRPSCSGFRWVRSGHGGREARRAVLEAFADRKVAASRPRQRSGRPGPLPVTGDGVTDSPGAVDPKGEATRKSFESGGSGRATERKSGGTRPEEGKPRRSLANQPVKASPKGQAPKAGWSGKSNASLAAHPTRFANCRPAPLKDALKEATFQNLRALRNQTVTVTADGFRVGG